MTHDVGQCVCIELTVGEKILRSVLVYFFLLIGLRVAGKRELAQLNAMDLVVLLLLSNTVQNAIIGDDTSVTGGLVGATTLLAVNYIVVRFLFTHSKLDRLIEGQAVTLIENGRLREDRLTKELVTRAELEAAAHKQGFASLSDVDRAVLEASGVISFVGKQPPVEESRQRELLTRLEQISHELAELRAAVDARG